MRPLDLAWVQYQSGTKLSRYLILYLGEANNYTYGFLSDKMPDREILAVRTNLDTLTKIDLPLLIQWSKAHLPISYRQCFRRLVTSQMVVEKTFSIKKQSRNNS